MACPGQVACVWSCSSHPFPRQKSQGMDVVSLYIYSQSAKLQVCFLGKVVFLVFSWTDTFKLQQANISGLIISKCSFWLHIGSPVGPLMLFLFWFFKVFPAIIEGRIEKFRQGKISYKLQSLSCLGWGAVDQWKRRLFEEAEWGNCSLCLAA